MKQNLKNVFRAFSVELPLYGAMMLAYVFVTLHILSGWLFQLYGTERKVYAVVALALIIGQGYIMEALARELLGQIVRKWISRFKYSRKPGAVECNRIPGNVSPSLR